jgi:hypothetical protein
MDGIVIASRGYESIWYRWKVGVWVRMAHMETHQQSGRWKCQICCGGKAFAKGDVATVALQPESVTVPGRQGELV